MTEATAAAIAAVQHDSPTPEMAAIEERIVNGIHWLTEHDPTGGLHFLYESGLRAHSRMPNREGDPEALEAWRSYATNRDRFEQLWRTMTILERKEARHAKTST